MIKQEYKKLPENEIEELKAFRQELHREPELSGNEYKTAEKIMARLKRLEPDELEEEVGGTGVLAVFDSGKPGESLLFRSEIDALPIEEVNQFPHRSVRRGISHKCGHDGHMAILMGLAQSIKKTPIPCGKIFLLFQPAEETGRGAKMVFNDPRFWRLKPDHVFALHNVPGFPTGAVVCKQGTFTAAVNSLIIRLHGKTAHAAEPEKGINPAIPIAKILQYASELKLNEPASPKFFLATPVYVRMGEKAYGVSAGEGEVHLTLRCWTNDLMERYSAKLIQRVRQIANNTGLEFEYSWTDEFYSNQNAEAAYQKVKKAAQLNELTFIEMDTPFKWGEDFGLFTEKYNGAMFGLGAGKESPALHNPDYDFPDELIEPGVKMFRTIIDLHLNQ